MADEPRSDDKSDLEKALDHAAIVPPDPDDQGDIAADDAGGTALAHRLEEAEEKSRDVGGE